MRNWRKKADKIINLLSDVSSSIIHFQNNPTLLGGVALGAATYANWSCMSYNELRTYWSDDHYILGVPYKQTVWDAMEETGNLTLTKKTQDGHVSLWVYKTDAIEMGWRVDRDNPEPTGPFIPSNVPNEVASQAVAALLWEKYGKNIAIISTEGGHKIGADILNDVLPSETARGIYDDLVELRKLGDRAVLIHGEPGTGKSEIAKWVAHELGGRTVRMDRDTASSRAVITMVKGLHPAAVIIDDIDHASGEMIFAFESLKRACGTVIATANNVSKLNPAMLRPGRFDSLIEVTQLDQSVYDLLTRGFSSDECAMLEGLPVAYIEEYRKLRQALGVARAKTRYLELRKRRQDIASSFHVKWDPDTEGRTPRRGLTQKASENFTKTKPFSG